jgi:cysteinyl-tRNA synthetase
MDAVLGLGLGRSEAKAAAATLSPEAATLAAERAAARESRDFARADELRAALAALGYTVTDTADGQQITQS